MSAKYVGTVIFADAFHVFIRNNNVTEYSKYVTCGPKRTGSSVVKSRKFMTETLLQAFPEAIALINPLASTSIVILSNHVGNNILKGNTKGVRNGVSFAKSVNGFGHQDPSVLSLSSIVPKRYLFRPFLVGVLNDTNDLGSIPSFATHTKKSHAGAIQTLLDNCLNLKKVQDSRAGAIAVDEDVPVEEIAASLETTEDIDAAELEYKKSDKIAKHFTKEIKCLLKNGAPGSNLTKKTSVFIMLDKLGLVDCVRFDKVQFQKQIRETVNYNEATNKLEFYPTGDDRTDTLKKGIKALPAYNPNSKKAKDTPDKTPATKKMTKKKKKKQTKQHLYDEDLASPSSTNSQDSSVDGSDKDDFLGIVSKDDEDDDSDIEIYDPNDGVVTPRTNPKTPAKNSPESMLPQSSSTKALRMNMDKQCFANRMQNKKRSLEEGSGSPNGSTRARRSGR